MFLATFGGHVCGSRSRSFQAAGYLALLGLACSWVSRERP